MITSEEHELFPHITNHLVWDHLQHIEVHCFGQGSALPDNHDISLLHRESWGTVDRNVPVSFFISVVFGHIVQIIASHHNSSLHLGGNDDSFQNFAPDRDIAGEGAFLIHIARIDRLLGGLESQPNIFEVSDSRVGLLGQESLAVQEYVLLFLECSFMLALWEVLLGYQPSVYLII